LWLSGVVCNCRSRDWQRAWRALPRGIEPIKYLTARLIFNEDKTRYACRRVWMLPPHNFVPHLDSTVDGRDVALACLLPPRAPVT
jgi:hypothetical protein